MTITVTVGAASGVRGAAGMEAGSGDAEEKQGGAPRADSSEMAGDADARMRAPPATLREALLEFLERVQSAPDSSAPPLDAVARHAPSPEDMRGHCLPPLPRTVQAGIPCSPYEAKTFVDQAVANTRTPDALAALYDALEDQYGCRPRHPVSDNLLFGGFHRRFLGVDDMRMQDPSIKAQKVPVLRPEERPAHVSVSHGVLAVFNNMAGEERQVMTERMCEGTYGNGKYPLHYAAYKGDAPAVKQILQKSMWRKSGANVIVEDHLHGRTPLHVACAAGHMAIADVLLKVGGAELNIVDHWGWSPLMYAVHNGHEDVARYLISSRGAHLNIKGNLGETAYSLTTVEHRGHALQRKALTKFIRDTEDALTVQSAADGWPCTFGLSVHKSRPLPRYKKATVTFDLDGRRMRLKYRTGKFGLRWATRYFNLHRIGWPGDEDSDPDPTSLIATESRASKAGATAAMSGHVRGIGRKIEPWMENSAEGSTIVELLCAGGWVVNRSEEEEDMDIENEAMQNRVEMTQGPWIRESNVDAIRLEVPIPEGLDCSFMLRYLEKLVADGKARAQADLERDRLERDARREAMRGKVVPKGSKEESKRDHFEVRVDF